MVDKLGGKFFAFMASLVADGGPSVTRWVFLRTSEVISLGWLGMVGCACFVFVKHQHVDITWCGMVLTLGAGLFKFAQEAQKTKLTLDATSATSMDSGPLSTAVETKGSDTGASNG